MPGKKEITWIAKPHTIAKIEMLYEYLLRWFQIMGATKRGQDIVHVDGFAGPGEYKNYSKGSPIQALVAAKLALASTVINWVAGDIHCVFVEENAGRLAHLVEQLKPFQDADRLRIYAVKGSFSDAIVALKHSLSASFIGSQPLFVFVDPFGATGVPFSAITDILSSPCSEVLINLDADGIARIFLDDQSAKHETLMNGIFGSDIWKHKLSKQMPFHILCREFLNLYKQNLRAVQGVKYVFPFEMRTSTGALDYYLVFASRHPLGL